LQLIDEEIVGVRKLLDKGLAPATRLRALERARADLIGRRGDLVAAIEVPVLTGKVERVSADRFVDERTGTPYFEARIVVAPQELARLEQSAARGRLQTGLPAEVIVPLRARTALQYLFEPLETAVWASFREH
jgi:HlyD family secretion protein